MIGGGALLVAAIAFYVLMNTGAPVTREVLPADSAPALDEIDAKSREAMRDLLREADEE